MSARRRGRQLLPFVTCALAAALLALGAYAGGLLSHVELDVVDAHFALRGHHAAPSEVVVVAIDDVTFADLQRRFPFSRRIHARLVDRLKADGVRAIGYDVQFTEPTTPAADNALIEAIAGAPRVVLSTTEVDEHGGSNVFGGDQVLRKIGARVGNTNIPLDADGAIRRFPYSVEGLKTFPVVLAERLSGRPLSAAKFEHGKALIDFPGPPGTVKTFSFSHVLNGEVPASALRGKTVIVGASAPSLQDVHPTSASRNEPMAGAEIEAGALDTILRGFPLRQAPAWLETLAIVVLAALIPLAGLYVRSWWRLLLLALPTAAAYAGVTQAAFSAGVVLPLTYPLLALSLATVATLGVEYLLATFERERVRDVFSRFVPETVVDEVLARTDETLRLGGEKRVATVMFCDLRGFTSFSEDLPAARVIEVVNVYLGEMTDAILAEGGTIVSYMGDGIMAVFGAPLDQPDHADRALRTAREMMGVRLPRFNAWLEEQGLPGRFRMGIGLNSGEVMAGNVGSERRMEFTAIGDTTNTASRLEGMTKGSDHMLFMAESTRRLLIDEPPDLAPVGEVEVRGRHETLRVWSLSDPSAPRDNRFADDLQQSLPALPERGAEGDGDPLVHHVGPAEQGKP